MDRNQLFNFIKENNCLEGGTKEASVIVREYLQYAAPIGVIIQAPQASVRNDEFLKAVAVLLAYASDKEDVVPETWHCENDCVYTNVPCKGECKIRKSSPKTCPYYVEEDK